MAREIEAEKEKESIDRENKKNFLNYGEVHDPLMPEPVSPEEMDDLVGMLEIGRAHV